MITGRQSLGGGGGYVSSSEHSPASSPAAVVVADVADTALRLPRSRSEAVSGPKALQVSPVARWVSPDNQQFCEDLKAHGPEICEYFAAEMEKKPASRTCPMPGAGAVCRQVERFIEARVLKDDQVLPADQALYQKLVQNMRELRDKNFPYYETLTLIYKAAHFVSFYNKDKATHIWQHRSRYQKDATLFQLDSLPWSSFLTEPALFKSQLKALWSGYFLNFMNTEGRKVCPLEGQSSFCVPCVDELSIWYFNRTWRLGVSPLGFLCPNIDKDAQDGTIDENKGTEALFDGLHGLCADVMEHDFAHSKYLQPRKKYYWAARILAEHFESSQPAGETITDTLDFPPAAVGLLLFKIDHEANLLLSQYGWEDIAEQVNKLFPSANDRLSPVYQDLQTPYQRLTREQVQRAGYFLHLLKETGYWQATSGSDAEQRLGIACKLYERVKDLPACRLQWLGSLDTRLAVFINSEPKSGTLFGVHRNASGKLQVEIQKAAVSAADDKTSESPRQLLTPETYLQEHLQQAVFFDRSDLLMDDLHTLSDGSRCLPLPPWISDIPKDACHQQPRGDQQELFFQTLGECGFWSAETELDMGKCLTRARAEYNALLLSGLYSAKQRGISQPCLASAPDHTCGRVKNGHVYAIGGHHSRLVRCEQDLALLLPVVIDMFDHTLYPTDDPRASVVYAHRTLHVYSLRTSESYRGFHHMKYSQRGGLLVACNDKGVHVISLHGIGSPRVVCYPLEKYSVASIELTPDKRGVVLVLADEVLTLTATARGLFIKSESLSSYFATRPTASIVNGSAT